MPHIAGMGRVHRSRHDRLDWGQQVGNISRLVGNAAVEAVFYRRQGAVVPRPTEIVHNLLGYGVTQLAQGRMITAKGIGKGQGEGMRWARSTSVSMNTPLPSLT